MHKKLQEVANGISLFKSISGVDAAIGVWNKEGVVEVFHKSNNLEIYFEPGRKLEDENDKLYEVLRTGVQVYNKVPREVFGHAFEGTITPIRDGNEIVGVVTYCVSTEEKESIIQNTNDLTDVLGHTDESIEEIKIGTETLASNMSKVKTITELVKEQAEQAAEVVENIKSNAKYSNILALNASIESARAGQAGKGFAVVSDEMRKFSKLSTDAAQKINDNLAQMVKSLDEAAEAIKASAIIAEEQAGAASHLNEKFDTVIASANKVNEICKTKVM
ncbi:methyl-accepting chemotaxis protein [Lachnospiraceae bacterium KM106-2]|nr:methyl-accepting chemotaxis protein [Lachnospiraceae bacterium KM106-2]